MSAIVYSEGKGRSAVRIAAGLRWVVLDGGLGRGKSQTSQIRIQAASIGSSRYVMQKSDAGDTVGLYNDPIVEDASLKGKIYSLSILMLTGYLQRDGVDPVGINAVLMMQPSGLPEKRLLIYIEGGQVTLDTILDRDKAIEQAKSQIDISPDAVLYLEHAEVDRAHERISWSDVVELIDKKVSVAVLKSVPVSPYLLPVIVLAIASAGGWYAYDQLVRQPEKRRLASIQAAKKDKTPVYVSASEQALRSTGWDRDDIKNFVFGLMSHPAYVTGWSFAKIACDQSGCISEWSRRGGIVTDLQAALPNEKMIILSQDGGNQSSTIEKTFMRQAYERKNAAIERSQLGTIEQSILEIRPVIQKLQNAGASATMGEFKKWEVASTSGVRVNELIYQTPVEVTMPLFRLSETLNMLPTNILLHSLVISNADGSLSFNLKGVAYAR